MDLPGYCYAKVSLEAKEKWGKMIERYLRNSAMLKLFFLLIDIRHEPSANDKMMYDWIIYNGYHPVIIATKLDKINRSQIQKNVKIVRQGLGMEKDGIIIDVYKRQYFPWCACASCKGQIQNQSGHSCL